MGLLLLGGHWILCWRWKTSLLSSGNYDSSDGEGLSSGKGEGQGFGDIADDVVRVNIDFKGIEILSSPKLSINSVTNAKATRYPFLEHDRHYMGGKQSGTYNRIVVEACVFVKVGTAIKDLETMKIPVMEEFFTTNTRVSCAQFLMNVLLTMICAQVCWRSMGEQKKPNT